MTKKEISLPEKNIVELIKALQDQKLDNAWIYISNNLVNELTKTADKELHFEHLKEIKWMSEEKPMGFVDFERRPTVWHKVYRINSGVPFYLENPKIPSKIICIN